MSDEEFRHSQHASGPHHHHHHRHHQHIDANSMSEIVRRKKKRMRFLSQVLFVTLSILAIAIICFVVWLYAGSEA